MTKNTNEKESSGKWTVKQIFALIGVCGLILLYLATLLFAIFDRSASGRWFWISLISTAAFPILLWIYSALYNLIKSNKKENSEK